MAIYGIPVVVFGWVWIATFFGSVFALVYAVSADARARGVGGSLWAGDCESAPVSGALVLVATGDLRSARVRADDA